MTEIRKPSVISLKLMDSIRIINSVKNIWYIADRELTFVQCQNSNSRYFPVSRGGNITGLSPSPEVNLNMIMAVQRCFPMYNEIFNDV